MTFNGNGLPPCWFIIGMVIIALICVLVLLHA